VVNAEPTAFTVDLAPNTTSGLVAYKGRSTRLLAVWSLPENQLISLQQLPILQSQTVVYKEFVEIQDGMEVYTRFFEANAENLTAPEDSPEG
jgi:hypothetical protein